MSAGSKQTLPHGSWPSDLSAEALVAGVVGFSSLSEQNGDIYWLESRPEEGGRSVLVRYGTGGTRDLTPAPYNVRSRVHEYGGGACTVAEGQAFFVNFSDQNLYRIDAQSRIHQITHSSDDTRFADFVLDARRGRLICVVEQHHPDREPDNCIAAVDLVSGQLTELASGHDFYAAPKLAPGGDQLAFIAWDHPNMPWDGTTLQVADMTADGLLTGLNTIAGGAAESVVQPQWLADGVLLFLGDANGFWNLHRYDASGIFCVLEDGADYAEPLWYLGLQNYTMVDGEHVIVTRQGPAGQELVLVNTATTMATPLLGDEAPWQHYESPVAVRPADGSGAMLYFIGDSAERSSVIARLKLNDGSTETLKSAGGPRLDPAGISRAEPIRFPTRDRAFAHAYFYPPASRVCDGPAGERPPLVVMSHGGPTAAASPTLNLRIQYYTSRGWAVLDVDYRGSSGYGRAYRTALNGRWGILDVEDCEDAVRYLVSQGRVDENRIAIRGGSAGGYTTLAALTTTRSFRAGASHYGIGDLTALARDTHKFESRYLQGLLNDPSDLTERSPINHLDGFSCPVIFFQGSEDRVVPPNQSRTMVEALNARGLPVAYLEFEGEGHGFRKAENIIRTMEAEFAFFCRVFAIKPADELPEIHILNAANL